MSSTTPNETPAEGKQVSDVFDQLTEALNADRRNTHASTIIKRGLGPELKGRKLTRAEEEQAVLFVAYPKELLLFKKEKELIKFNDHTYRTSNPEDIAYIREHSAFGRHIWEREFPKEVLQKFETDKTHLTKNEDMFDPAEA